MTMDKLQQRKLLLMGNNMVKQLGTIKMEQKNGKEIMTKD